MERLRDKALRAKQSAKRLATADSGQKNAALGFMADGLAAHAAAILAANLEDLEQAKRAGLSAAMLDRLSLQGRLEDLARDVRAILRLKDPIGELLEQKELENGLKLSKVRVPLGVLGVIYEARPNVTMDVAAIAIKTGNAVLLRGGSETLRTNRQLIAVVHEALEKAGLPRDVVQFIDNPDRAQVKEMLSLSDCLDVIIPRGGAGLHSFCRDNSRVPVITGGIGICHLYVDQTADLEGAQAVIRNAKIQRPTVCNALDTVLIHAAVAPALLPALCRQLRQDGVLFKLDSEAGRLVGAELGEAAEKAVEADWRTEWLSLVLGIKVVAGLQEAIDHIGRYGSGHSDGILTRTEAHAEAFVREVDSAAVYVNASTRFTDGSQFGLGAEVAISTQKLHARGPMGLEELTSYKWIVRGNQHIRP